MRPPAASSRSAFRDVCQVLSMVVGLGACRSQPAPTSSQSLPSASEPAVAAPVHAPVPAANAPEVPPGPVLELGPSLAAARAAREDAVAALLRGEARADALPELATEPGAVLDPGLRNRLAPVTEQQARGAASIGHVDAPESVENAARVVAGMRARFRNCYLRELEAKPGISSTVRVTLTVGEEGAVTALAATPTGALPRSLLDCIACTALSVP